VTPLVAPFRCQDPDEYLFWDGIHPTRAAHAALADAVANLLGL
jgi:phospholipase/lecithinase/hemolysin